MEFSIHIAGKVDMELKLQLVLALPHDKTQNRLVTII